MGGVYCDEGGEREGRRGEEEPTWITTTVKEAAWRSAVARFSLIKAGFGVVASPTPTRDCCVAPPPLPRAPRTAAPRPPPGTPGRAALAGMLPSPPCGSARVACTRALAPRSHAHNDTGHLARLRTSYYAIRGAYVSCLCRNVPCGLPSLGSSDHARAGLRNLCGFLPRLQWPSAAQRCMCTPLLLFLRSSCNRP